MKTKDIAYTALCTAIIAVSAWIAVPLPGVPFTMQVFGVAFAAYFLGIKRSWIAVTAYLALGAAGVPVFNSFTGGYQSIIGPTGGFLTGFIPMTIIISLFTFLGKDRLIFKIVGSIVGHVVLYATGVTQLAVITLDGSDFFSRFIAVAGIMVPFYLIDIIKIAVAMVLADMLKKVLKYN